MNDNMFQLMAKFNQTGERPTEADMTGMLGNKYEPPVSPMQPNTQNDMMRQWMRMQQDKQPEAPAPDPMAGLADMSGPVNMQPRHQETQLSPEQQMILGGGGLPPEEDEEELLRAQQMQQQPQMMPEAAPPAAAVPQQQHVPQELSQYMTGRPAG